MTLRKALSNVLLLAPNRVFRRALDWAGRPVFYDIDRVCPELLRLERNYLSIKAEFDLPKQHLPAIPAYYEVDRHQERIAKSPPGGKWRFFEAMSGLCPRINSADEHRKSVRKIHIKAPPPTYLTTLPELARVLP
jgi:hypothetical protein